MSARRNGVQLRKRRPSHLLPIPEQSLEEGNLWQNGLNCFPSSPFSDPVPFVEVEYVKWTFDVTELEICTE